MPGPREEPTLITEPVVPRERPAGECVPSVPRERPAEGPLEGMVTSFVAKIKEYHYSGFRIMYPQMGEAREPTIIERNNRTVSYTHLTLPTIYSV